MIKESFKISKLITDATHLIDPRTERIGESHSADEIANKITVPDSIIWVLAVVNQISKSCFRKAGFRGSDEKDVNNEIAVDSLDDLLNKLPSVTQVSDSD